MSSRGNLPFVGRFLYSTFGEEFDQPNSSVACKGKELESPIRITGEAGGCFCQTLTHLHLALLLLRAAVSCKLSLTGGTDTLGDNPSLVCALVSSSVKSGPLNTF